MEGSSLSKLQQITESDFLLRLSCVPELGSSGILRIVEKNVLNNISPEEFFSLSEEALKNEYDIKPSAVQHIKQNFSQIENMANEITKKFEGKPVYIISTNHPLYPTRLHEFCDPLPGMLFLYGNLEVLKSKTFCFLSSRNAPEDVLRKIEVVVEESVLEPMTLVTGVNTVAYQKGAVVPLRWGAPRILVLDRGFFETFGDDLLNEPFPQARLWRYKFDPLTDLAISRFRPNDGFMNGNAALRDEMVVGLSDVVKAIHVNPGGNMAKLMHRANQCNREIVKLF